MDISQFEIFLYQKCLVKPNDFLLVGVSGGSDSICLLDMLHKLGINVIVANFNHHLRQESDTDSQFVKQVAISRSLEFIQGNGDVLQFARNKHKTVEEAARILRYKFLFENAVKRENTTVAVGHTADDQVETILMHLLRGCGLEGLQGMQPRIKTDFSHELSLIRPLLFAWKEEVKDYCRINNLSYLDDNSNLNIEYFRNRLRVKLIPDLQQYNLHAKSHIINLGKIVSGDLEFVIQASNDNYKKCLINEGEGFIAFSHSKMLTIADSQKRRVIQMALKKLLPSGIESNFDFIEKIVKFVFKPNCGKHLELLSHLEILIEGDYLYIFRNIANLPYNQWPVVNKGFNHEMEIPGEHCLSSNWTVRTKIVSIKEVKFPDYSGQLITFTYLDFDKLDKKLLIRTQMPGDRYFHLGLNGKSQKLSDFWINSKVPKRVRSTWPIVINKDEIIWIPGFQPSYAHRITGATQKVLRMEIVKK